MITHVGKTTKVGDLFFSPYISKIPENHLDYIEVGIWDAGSTILSVEELKELRAVVNELLIKLMFKTTTK